jgi:hypothetical protein
MSQATCGRVATNLEETDTESTVIKSITTQVDGGDATGRYFVRGAGTTVLVDMDAGTCECSTEGMCDHRREVAQGITYGDVPAPGQTAGLWGE